MKALISIALAASTIAGIAGCCTENNCTCTCKCCSECRQRNEKTRPDEYCIIDLSGGHDSQGFSISYSSACPTGDVYKLDKLVLKRIPAGTFKMCNKANVTISKPFYMGVYEITRKQYELITGFTHRYWGKAIDSHPASFITYNELRGTAEGSKWPVSTKVDPDSFVGRLRRLTGIDGFDLPTEAQWEYACRAGTTTKYNNGGNTAQDLNKLGRYSGTGKGYAVVGSYVPNAWGLYDMHGNVFEWCLDWGPWPLKECTDPVGSTNGRNRCLRGGCVDYRDYECTSDFRYYAYGYPSNESAYFGVRIVCPASESSGVGK